MNTQQAQPKTKIEARAFEEAQYMAQMAMRGGNRVITPVMYWDAGMLALKEAYGVGYDH